MLDQDWEKIVQGRRWSGLVTEENVKFVAKRILSVLKDQWFSVTRLIIDPEDVSPSLTIRVSCQLLAGPTDKDYDQQGVWVEKKDQPPPYLYFRDTGGNREASSWTHSYLIKDSGDGTYQVYVSFKGIDGFDTEMTSPSHRTIRHHIRIEDHSDYE